MEDYRQFITAKIAEAEKEFAEKMKAEQEQAKAIQEAIRADTAEHEDETPVFYGVKDIAKLLGCSIPTARDIMRRSDFPLIVSGKRWIVLRSAFIKWASVKRI